MKTFEGYSIGIDWSKECNLSWPFMFAFFLNENSFLFDCVLQKKFYIAFCTRHFLDYNERGFQIFEDLSQFILNAKRKLILEDLGNLIEIISKV